MLPERLKGSGDPFRLERFDAAISAQGIVAPAQCRSRRSARHAADQGVAPGAAELALRRGARRRRVPASKGPLVVQNQKFNETDISDREF